MEKIGFLRSMLKEYKRDSGKDPSRGHVVVVDVGGAQSLLREIFFTKLPKGVKVTDDADELFSVDGIPVRLRYEVPYGSAFVIPTNILPPRACCDAAAMSTLLCAMSRGNS